MADNEIPNVIGFPTKTLNFLLLLSPGKLTKSVIFCNFCCVILALANLAICLIQYGGLKGDINEFSRVLEGHNNTLQIFTKLINLIYYRENILELVSSSRKFLTPEKYAPPSKIASINGLLSKLEIFQKVFVVAAMSFTIISSIAVFLGKAPLVTGIWTLEGYENLHNVAFYINVYLFWSFGVYVSAFDVMYIGLCFRIGVEFKLLKYHTEQLFSDEDSTENLREKIKFIVDHHNFLLDYIKKFKHILASIMLLQYLVSTCLMCSLMYILTESHNWNAVIRSSALLLIAFVEITIYSLSAEFMSSQAESPAFAPYFSNWTGCISRDLKMALLMITIRSQRREELTIGYLANACALTLLKCLRTSYSAVMVLRNIRQR